jgi:hypothetical protein
MYMKRLFFALITCLSGTYAYGGQHPYFQQQTDYKIQVRLDDTKNELFAEEKIEYTNNSSDALPYLYFHLWANAYKNDQTQLAKQLRENGNLTFHYSKAEDRGYIDQLDFKVNDQTVKWEFAGDTIDICRIWLSKPLQPGEHITISTPFHVKIPLGKFSRLGHLDQQYQITQWYPKPAVYDNNGWNQMPFLNQGEFYSEFGTYDVEITLPKNYIIGATGDLINGDTERRFLENQCEQTKAWKAEFERTGVKNYSFPPSDPENKTLHFHQEKVHDFAWFCDKRYHVLKGQVETPHDHRIVETWAMFTDEDAENWVKSIPYINDAITFYSLWNGDYPYNQVTAVDGGLSAGTGMEYPNVTVIGNISSDLMLETVIVHEVGHNWFYGMLGSNERKNPWMDEGINSFDENRYIETKYPDSKMITGVPAFIGKRFDLDRYKHRHQYYLEYLFNARKELDQPIQLSAPEYTSFNYGGIVYAKTGLAFQYLMAFLGTSTMDAAMHAYFEKWKYKHPQPDDLRKVLEKVSGKDLSWFFDDLINTTKKLDYQILASAPGEHGYRVAIKNVGQIKGPVALCGVKNGIMRGVVWYDGFWGTEVLSFPAVDDGIDYFMIDFNSDMPEIDRKNNILKTHGLFKRIEPLKLQFIGSLERPDKTQLFFTPVVGWNNYNKTMLGLALYNTILPQKKLEYLLMPMYGFGTKDLNGTANLSLNLPLQQSFIQQVTLRLSATRYAFNDNPAVRSFNRIVPEINFELRKKPARSHIKQNIKVRSIILLLDQTTTDYIYGSTPVLKKKTDTILINNIRYTLTNSRKLNPYSLAVDYQQGQNMQKISATINSEITFKKGKGVEFRLFAGYFLQTDNDPAYAFHLSGETGSQDYLFDRIYLGRSQSGGILSKQFSETDGAFKVYYPAAQSNKWISSLNVKSCLPALPKAFRLYADLGMTGGSVQALTAPANSLFYTAGFNLSLPKNIFEINFPIVMSPQIHTYLYTNSKFSYLETIRFTLNLNLLNPFEQIRNISVD